MAKDYCAKCARKLWGPAYPGGVCMICHQQWVTEYTRPEAKAKREAAYRDLVAYAQRVGLAPRSYLDEEKTDE